MTRYQVTALFAGNYEVVGEDTVDFVEAYRLYEMHRNVNRPVRVHKLVGSGSRVILEAN